MLESTSNIPALCLHDIRPNPGADIYAIEPSQLDELLTSLIFTNLSSIQRGVSIPGSVLLTFDDGYAHHIEYALPILAKHNVDAIFFLLPIMLGQSNLWDHRAKVVIDHLAQSQVQELVDGGQTIGSHGLTHQNVVKLSQPALLNELTESRSRLQDLSGRPVEAYAYPYGDFTANSAEIVKRIYDYAFSTDQGNPNWPNNANQSIKRISVRGNQSTESILSKIKSYSST